MTVYSSGRRKHRVTQSRWGGNYRAQNLPLRNWANRVLKDFRAAVERGDEFADPRIVLANLADMSADSDAWRYTASEIVHAERVLLRLAALVSGADR